MKCNISPIAAFSNHKGADSEAEFLSYDNGLVFEWRDVIFPDFICCFGKLAFPPSQDLLSLSSQEPKE